MRRLSQENSNMITSTDQPITFEMLLDRPSIESQTNCLLSLAKSETLRSARRRQIGSPALLGFPVWGLLLFLFENFYEHRRVTLSLVCNEIERSEMSTVRFLRQMESEGLVRVKQDSTEADISISLTMKSHDLIAEYLQNDG